MRQAIRDLGIRFVQRFGAEILDQETGHSLGRALLVPWAGKIHVIGLSAAVRPVFLPQKRLTYWKQELGFTAHPAVDFPRASEKGDSHRPG